MFIDSAIGFAYKRENRPGKGGLSDLNHVVTMIKTYSPVGEQMGSLQAISESPYSKPHPNTKHGFARHRNGLKKEPEYAVWAAMIQRCKNPNNKGFENYGGRGIKVCPEWKSFVSFIASMGKRPSPKHCIDRLDNNGNYEPSNCAWVTRKEQNRNRRMKRILVIDGKSMSLIEWSEESNIPHAIIRNRLRYGWENKDAVFTPVNAILKYEKRL